MNSSTRTSLKFHDSADLFPKLLEPDYQALKADLQAHGQRVKIPLYQGKAIEGRARYRACQELGIKPATEEINDPGSLVSYVVSLNRHRRHLTSSQLAAIAVEYKQLLAKEAAARQKSGQSADGTAGGRGRKKNLPQKIGEGLGQGSKHDGETAQQVAKALGTNRQYVTEVERIQEEDPSLFKQVHSGQLTLAQAQRVLGKAKAQKLAKEEPPAGLEDLEDALGRVQSILGRYKEVVQELAPDLTKKPKDRLTKQLRTIRDSVQTMLRTLEGEPPLHTGSSTKNVKG